MFKKPKKEIFILRRVLLSALATISVLIIASASILFMLGYRLDSGNGRFEQGALLQFDSKPNGADIWIDGSALGSQTASKQIVLAGTHSVKMTKKGYEDWSRTLTLEAGTLTWLDYVRLVPKDRPVTPVATYQALAGLTFSPDRKWALALEDAAVPAFRLVDLRSEEVKSSELLLPSTLYTPQADGTSQFSMYRWNSEGRYLIVKHAYGDGQTEWLMLDTQDILKSVNITQLLSVELKDVQFAGTSGTNLYGLTSEDAIRKLDLSAGTLSRAFMTHVSSFSVFADTGTISFVGLDPSDPTRKVAGIYKDGGVAPTILRSASDPSVTLSIALGRYFSDTFVAIAQGETVTVSTGSLPSDGVMESGSLHAYDTLKLAGPVTSLSFSEEGDFLVAQAGSTLTGYEVEHKRKSTVTVTASGDQPAEPLHWLDFAHLWNTDNGTLVMRDFDGSNTHAIMPITEGFDASLSTNGKFFYAVGATEQGYQLQRVRMILN